MRYGHANIIKFCHRQFSSVEEMNYTLVKNWNQVVSPNDDVWHLGDVALGSANVKQFVSGKKGCAVKATRLLTDREPQATDTTKARL